MTSNIFKVFLRLLPVLILAGGIPAGAGEMVLADKGRPPVPIVIGKDAPPCTRQAADELAMYIEKMSGAKPQVIEGCSDPMPEHAIWVGFQPELKKTFSKVDFEFKHPEEILIACDGKNLVIAGRDRWDPAHLEVPNRGGAPVKGVQQEYGTCNAVYTFLQDRLGVRWLWPGELGEDAPAQDKIALAPFEYRYHPALRGRATLFVFSMLLQDSGYGISRDWVRRQRLQLDSLDIPMGHAFKTWWERFHATHPEYFALQPDGTRGGGETPYPGAESIKMCESNPGVWDQWMKEVEEQLKLNPNQVVFNASPNDGYNQGNCICTNCRAWDSPDADLRPNMWRGLAQPYVALSDRDVTFANNLARLLKKQYPDKDYYVSMLAYGNSRPGPKKAVPADNVIIVNVANMIWDVNTPDKDGQNGKTYSQEYAEWGKVTKNHAWRPNTGNPAGWQSALPDVPISRVMESFHFAVSNKCIGIGVDSIWEQWANQGPLYYVLAQMTWNPAQDWRAVMEDYCRRAYGPAAGELKNYWQLMEDARNRKVDQYGGGAEGYAEVYNREFFEKAGGLLDRAVKKVKDSPQKYADRIAFTRVGFDAARLMADLREMGRIFARGGADSKQAADQARAKWKELEQLAKDHPVALNWGPIRPNKRMASGGLFHPDSMKASQAAPAYKPAAAGKAAALEPAEKAGWQLVFSDDFKRDKLGDDWKILDGSWAVEDGALRGSGTLASTRGFPGDGSPAFQRIEFEVVTDVKPSAALGQSSDEPLPVSDLSSIIHGKLDPDQPDFMKSGYFFQFGWKMNKRTRISKAGQVLAADNEPATLIVPGKVHKMVVENDGGALRMFVDGALVIEAKETQSTLGAGHDRVGFYFFTAAKVLGVKVYVKKLSGGLDLE